MSIQKDRNQPRRLRQGHRRRRLTEREVASALLLFAPPADREETRERLDEAADHFDICARTRRMFRREADRIRKMGFAS